MTDCYNIELKIGDQVWINKPTIIIKGCPFTDQWLAKMIECKINKFNDEICIFETEEGKKFKFNQKQIDQKHITKKIY